jgi:hypothetical protein
MAEYFCNSTMLCTNLTVEAKLPWGIESNGLAMLPPTHAKKLPPEKLFVFIHETTPTTRQQKCLHAYNKIKHKSIYIVRKNSRLEIR